MSPSGLLRLLVPAPIITLAIAVPAQAPPATTSDSASDPNVLTNKHLIEMVSAKLPEEIIITKIQTVKTNFDLSTSALVELSNSGVSANIVKAMMTPKSVQRGKRSRESNAPLSRGRERAERKGDLHTEADLKRERTVDRRVSKACDILAMGWNKRVALTELSANVGLSRSRLEHLFKMELGVSIRQHVLSYRLEAAAHLLAATDLRIKEICYRVGFGDLSGFDHLFKRKF